MHIVSTSSKWLTWFFRPLPSILSGDFNHQWMKKNLEKSCDAEKGGYRLKKARAITQHAFTYHDSREVYADRFDWNSIINAYASMIQARMIMFTLELMHCILQKWFAPPYETPGFVYATQSNDTTLLNVYSGVCGDTHLIILIQGFAAPMVTSVLKHSRLEWASGTATDMHVCEWTHALPKQQELEDHLWISTST